MGTSMLTAKAGAPRAESSQVRMVLGSERVSPMRTKQFDAMMERKERFWSGVIWCGWLEIEICRRFNTSD